MYCKMVNCPTLTTLYMMASSQSLKVDDLQINVESTLPRCETRKVPEIAGLTGILGMTAWVVRGGRGETDEERPRAIRWLCRNEVRRQEVYRNDAKRRVRVHVGDYAIPADHFQICLR